MPCAVLSVVSASARRFATGAPLPSPALTLPSVVFAVFARSPADAIRVADLLAAIDEQLVELGDRVGRVREHVLDRVAIVVEHRRHAVEHFVEPRDHEIGARRIVDGRCAVDDRVRRDRRLVPVAAGHDLEVLLAEHARGVDEELGVAADAVTHAIFDPRGHANLHALAADFRIGLAAEKVDGFDLADLDAGDFHRRAGLQRADVVVVDLDREARVQREVAEHEDEADEDRARDEDQ